MLVESRHSAVVSETATHAVVDGLSLLNSCPLLQLYVTFEPSGHDVASVELLLPLATTGMSPQYTTTICNIDISVSSVSTYNQQTQKITIFLKYLACGEFADLDSKTFLKIFSVNMLYLTA